MRFPVVMCLALLAACGGGNPPDTSPDDAQVPPANAGTVGIESVALTSGDRVELGIEGTKPTPCHEVGWVASPGGEVTIWSEAPEPGVACAQVIEPFSITIDLGPLESGTEVVVNGEVVGTVG